MMAKKIGIKTKFGMMIGHDMMTAIGRTKIDVIIIDGTIGIMITEEMIIVTMITVGIIVTNMTMIIHQEMIEMTGGHTKVTNIMMIEGGMMIIVDSMMTEGMILYDPKELDNFNIILKVEMMQTHMMFGSHSMKREKLVDRRCRVAIFAGKMVTMQISAQQRVKAKHRQLILGYYHRP